ncbi:MAG: bifunctional diaminohydroxyphosphoribosylaminopyrimidine deaminase/5-amino-6-(5-phosphoribosylamino)uracil reductase RibD [Thermoleophilaceae bacterium]|nr:bifunctional diaminohydroxyphosphoribosylaminopyrimidine deaminase/5-amino-6-(5-phosphoribosylamino)uracil reductase RibD [Thermoleophilaceae bacterium]
MNQATLTDQDVLHLERALELAAKGRGHTSPNPLVGAVIVRDGEVLGEGFHAAYGELHAERAAIEACTVDPIGATIYVSLEPCAHEGKQPACTDAIIAAGITKVVYASDDPTEKASGRGPGILRDEGITVVAAQGEIAAKARLLNQPFRKFAKTGRPHVVFKAAMTLDGKVATASGDSQWISSERSRMLAHEIRGNVDAVAVGIGTALADDPQLTVRHEVVENERQPTRVIFDSEARLPIDGVLVSSARDVPVILVASRAAPREALEALEGVGVTPIVASGENEAARVLSALTELGAQGIQSLLLEGGPHLAGAFFEAGEVDEVSLFLAPMVLGGRQARAAVEGVGVEKIADAYRALSMNCQKVGEDILVTARIKEW